MLLPKIAYSEKNVSYYRSFPQYHTSSLHRKMGKERRRLDRECFRSKNCSLQRMILILITNWGKEDLVKFIMGSFPMDLRGNATIVIVIVMHIYNTVVERETVRPTYMEPIVPHYCVPLPVKLIGSYVAPKHLYFLTVYVIGCSTAMPCLLQLFSTQMFWLPTINFFLSFLQLKQLPLHNLIGYFRPVMTKPRPAPVKPQTPPQPEAQSPQPQSSTEGQQQSPQDEEASEPMAEETSQNTEPMV